MKLDAVLFCTMLGLSGYADAPPSAKKRMAIDCKSTCPKGMAKLKKLNGTCGYCDDTEYYNYEDCICVALSDEYPDQQYCPVIYNHTLSPDVDKDKVTLCTKGKCFPYGANNQSWKCCEDPDDGHPVCQTTSKTPPYTPTAQPEEEVTTHKSTTEVPTQTVDNNTNATHVVSNTTGVSTVTGGDGGNNETIEEHSNIVFIIGAICTVLVLGIIVAVCYACNRNLCGTSNDNVPGIPDVPESREMLQENDTTTNNRIVLPNTNGNATHRDQHSSNNDLNCAPSREDTTDANEETVLMPNNEDTVLDSTVR